MTAISLAAKLIRVFEGCKLEAYWDKHGKVWTIGYGHTAGVKEGDRITPEQAEAYLAADVAHISVMVEHLPILQAAALISFGYNVGADDVQRVLNGALTVQPAGFTTADGSLFGRRAGGVVLEGLVARRELEAALYLVGAGTAAPKPPDTVIRT